MCQDKGQYAFNIQADYSIYTAVNDRLSDIYSYRSMYRDTLNKNT